jgi:hypothetical protein
MENVFWACVNVTMDGMVINVTKELCAISYQTARMKIKVYAENIMNVCVMMDLMVLIVVKLLIVNMFTAVQVI